VEFQKYKKANQKLMKRMGSVVANDTSSFVSMLDNAGVNASEYDAPEVLIDKYVDELPDNDQLKVMSAYLIENQEASNFSGKVDNNEVYENYNVIYNYWDWDSPEGYSNAGGVVGAVAEGVGALANVGNTALQGRQKKKYGATDTAMKKQETKAELLKSVIAQKQAKAEKEKVEADAKAKRTKYWIIGGSVVGGLAIIGLVIYFVRKNK
jgi:hypothetical protein